MALTDEERRRVLEELTGKYRTASEDTSEVDSAKENGDRSNMIAGVGQGLATMLNANSAARGGAAVDNSIYDSIRSQARNRIKDAQEARQGKLSGMQTEIGMNRDSLKDSMDKSKFDADEVQRGITNTRNTTNDTIDDRVKEGQLAVSQRNAATNEAEAAAKAEEGRKPKPLTEGQAKSAANLSKMQAAATAMTESGDISQGSLEKLNSQNARNDLLDTKIFGIPVGAAVEATGLVRRPKIGDALTPDEQKSYQSQSQWMDANLRDASGATISPEEMKGERARYFPALGDSPEVIEQKRLMRSEAEKAMSLKLQDPSTFTPVDTSPKDRPAPPPPIDQESLNALPDEYKSILAKEGMTKGRNGMITMHNLLMRQDPKYKMLMTEKATKEEFVKGN